MKIISITKTNKRQKMLPAFFVALAFVFTSIFSSFNPAEAAFNKEINYQGKLTTSNSIAVADGTYNMEFKLYTLGGTTLWTETRTGGDRVPVSSGLFSVMLGELSSLSTVDFNQTLYLGVNIGGTSATPAWDGEMTPRKKLGVVPAAIESERAVSATKSTNLMGGNSTSLLGAVPYQSDTDTTSFVSPNVTLTKKFFSMTGTGTNGAVPLWEALVAGDVGLGNVTNESKTTMFTAPTFTGSTLVTGDLTVADETNTVRTFLKPINDSGAVGTSSNHPLGFYTNNSQVATILTNGNFGIGTTTPNNLFQVAGLINFNDTDFNTSIGKNAGLNVIAGAGYNSFVGYEAGKGGTGGTNAADNNSALGYQAFYSNKGGYNNTASGMKALYSNTYGNYNTASGVQSLHGNTTGSWNTASGYQALYNGQAGSGNTADGYVSLYMNAGDNNTASGYASLYSNTTGYSNTATGYRAISSNTTGYNNTASGMYAGRYIAGGTVANQTSNNSVYEGYNAMAGADGNTNEIVIGANATGNGSDTVTLGNTSITKTILQGSVGIGTAAPGSKLQVTAGTTSSYPVGFTTNDWVGGTTGSRLVFGFGSTTGNTYSSINAQTAGASAAGSLVLADIGGNVGVGTTGPESKLHIVGAAGNMLQLTDSSSFYYAKQNAGSIQARTNANEVSSFSLNPDGGNVGVGTTTPEFKLDVWGGDIALARTQKIQFTGPTIGDRNRAYIASDPNNELMFGIGGSVEAMRIAYDSNVGIGTTTPRQKLEVSGNAIFNSSALNVYMQGNSVGDPALSFSRYAGADLTLGAKIQYVMRSAASQESGALAFWTNPNTAAGTDLTERMRIDYNGNVGIGTTTPGQILETRPYVGDGHPGLQITTPDITTTEAMARFFSDSTKDWWIGLNNNDGTQGDFSIYDAGTTGGVGNRLTVTNSGNVGIGKTDPTYKLQVSVSEDFTLGEHFISGFGLLDGTVAVGYYADGTAEKYGYIRSRHSVDLSLGAGAPDQLYIKQGGNVGIGTTAPLKKLHVAEDLVYSQSQSGQLYVGGATNPNKRLMLGYDTTNNFAFIEGVNFGTAYSNVVINPVEGNVGIGIMTPLDKLSLAGNLGFYNTAGDGATNVVLGTIGARVRNYGTTSGASFANISILTDPTTWYRGVITFSTNGTDGTDGNNQPTERMRITSNGNVGIGTTSPAGSLDIYGTTGFKIPIGYFTDNATDDPQLRMSNGKSTRPTYGFSNDIDTGMYFGGAGIINFTTGGNDAVTINNGNVGIGTTTPNGKLQIGNNLTATTLWTSGGTYTANEWNTLNDSSTDGLNGTVGLTIHNNNTTDGNWARLSFSTYEGTGGNNISAAMISARFTNRVVNSWGDGDLAFSTNYNSGLVERMRILANGNIGIGTTTPLSALEIYKSHPYGAGVTDVLTITNAPTGNNPDSIGLAFRHNDTGNHVNWYPAKIVADKAYDGTNFSGSLYFQTKTSDTSQTNLPTTKMAILENGNIGIGTTTPQKILDVVGGADDFVTVGARLLSTGQWTGIHFGYRENNTSYRKSAIVFERADTGYGDGSGSIHILNDGSGTSSSADLGDARLTINRIGNVGIGTTVPASALHLKGPSKFVVESTSGDYGQQQILNTADGESSMLFANNVTGGIGGTVTVSDLKYLWGLGLGRYGLPRDVFSITSYSATAGIVITSSGFVGIGTTSPGNILTIQQTSATDPIADAWTTYSSGRWKENREPIVNALEKINELNPVYFDWTADHGGAHDLGFIAEEVGLIIPEVVAWEDNGIDAKSIDYARLSTIAIAGIKEMNLNIGAITGTIIPTPGSQEEIFANNFFDNVFAKVGSWLGDIDNGLEKIFVKEIRTKKLCVLDEEGVETCVIKSQLDALLASAGESGAGVSGGDTAGGADAEFNPKAPVVTLNGDAVINLIKGDTYEEQGAIVTDDVDVDLVATISGEIDTSVVGSYTLSYIVTDTEGHMSIPVVRTVNVEEPAAPASSSAPSVPEAEADTDTPPAPSVTTTGTLSGGTDTSTSSGATATGDSAPATPSGDTTTGA